MGWDFVHALDPDVSAKILTCLDEPADIARVGSVSRSWRDIVISSGICKNLCLKLFPQLSGITHVVNISNKQVKCTDVGSSSSIDWEHLKREHRVYTSLIRRLTSSEVGECLSYAITASSTDNYPREGVHNTLESWDDFRHIASYWSSSGQSNPEVPETLTYKLVSDLCVITEVNIQPFQAFFQANFPIYSAKAVRFRMGHWLLPDDSEEDHRDQNDQPSAERKLVWTYTTQEFPIVQENSLQHFKLPEPVLCIGGILQIELLGRVQKQASDGLFYICVAYVQVGGRPLSPVFGAEAIDTSEKFTLVYDPQAQFSAPASIHTGPDEIMMMQPMVEQPIGEWHQILNVLHGAQVVEFDSDDEHQFQLHYQHHDSDEEEEEEMGSDP